MSETLFKNTFTLTEKVGNDTFSYDFDIVFTDEPTLDFHPPAGPEKSGDIYGPFDAAMVLDSSSRLDSLGRKFDIEASYKSGVLTFQVQKSDKDATLHLSCADLDSLRENYLDFKLGQTDLLSEGSALESADGLALTFSNADELAGKASFELNIRANPHFGNVRNTSNFDLAKVESLNETWLLSVLSIYKTSSDDNPKGTKVTSLPLNFNWRAKLMSTTDGDRFNNKMTETDLLLAISLYRTATTEDKPQTEASIAGISVIEEIN